MPESAISTSMPKRRAGHTTAVVIGGATFHLTANAREDGSLGEVFLRWGKQGTAGAGLLDVYAIALSAGVQHGVPLDALVRQGLDLHFEPNGRTDDPQIPRVRSVADYVARRLAIDWLPTGRRAQLGIFTVAERVERARAWMDVPGARLSAENADVLDRESVVSR